MPEFKQLEGKAEELLRVIADAIKRGRIREGDPTTFLSYSEALSLLGAESPGIRSGSRLQRQGLKALDSWTKGDPRLPKVGALIVNKKTRIPSPGFAQSHGHGDDPDWRMWWLQEANRAIHYDWSPFLSAIHVPREDPEGIETSVREDQENEAPGYNSVIIAIPPPAHIRKTRITVNQILRWLAAGQPEDEILRQNPGLKRGDIRASLAYAADREKQAARPSFTERWAGKFTLPKPDPKDSRLTYLLERYEGSHK